MREGTRSPASLLAPVRATPAGVGGVDGDRGRVPGDDGAADPSSIRSRSESEIGRSSGVALHVLKAPGLSAKLCAVFYSQCREHGGLRNSGGLRAEGVVRLYGELPGELRGFFRGDGSAAGRLRQGSAAGREFF